MTAAPITSDRAVSGRKLQGVRMVTDASWDWELK